MFDVFGSEEACFVGCSVVDVFGSKEGFVGGAVEGFGGTSKVLGSDIGGRDGFGGAVETGEIFGGSCGGV